MNSPKLLKKQASQDQGSSPRAVTKLEGKAITKYSFCDDDDEVEVMVPLLPNMSSWKEVDRQSIRVEHSDMSFTGTCRVPCVVCLPLPKI